MRDSSSPSRFQVFIQGKHQLTRSLTGQGRNAKYRRRPLQVLEQGRAATDEFRIIQEILLV